MAAARGEQPLMLAVAGVERRARWLLALAHALVLAPRRASYVALLLGLRLLRQPLLLFRASLLELLAALRRGVRRALELLAGVLEDRRLLLQLPSERRLALGRAATAAALRLRLRGGLRRCRCCGRGCHLGLRLLRRLPPPPPDRLSRPLARLAAPKRAGEELVDNRVHRGRHGRLRTPRTAAVEPGRPRCQPLALGLLVLPPRLFLCRCRALMGMRSSKSLLLQKGLMRLQMQLVLVLLMMMMPLLRHWMREM
jgi:hypothetical protein